MVPTPDRVILQPVPHAWRFTAEDPPRYILDALTEALYPFLGIPTKNRQHKNSKPHLRVIGFAELEAIEACNALVTMEGSRLFRLPNDLTYGPVSV
jgi:hypothetical protein